MDQDSPLRHKHDLEPVVGKTVSRRPQYEIRVIIVQASRTKKSGHGNYRNYVVAINSDIRSGVTMTTRW
jgi:hypothetical protein